MSPKIALVYDRVNTIGGAERVLEALHEVWPEAPLYTSVYQSRTAPWAEKFRIIPSFLQRVPWARSRHEFFVWLMPVLFEGFNFDEYDIVISITSAEAKGVVTKPETLHLSYVLTPTRYLWSQTHFYSKSRFLLFQWFKFWVFSQLRKWDYVAAQRPDTLIPISKTVSQRIETYYNRKPEPVIYPPVTPLTTKQNKEPVLFSDYYLVVSRLVPYKRVDLAIQACQKLKKKLVIVGDGSQRKKLEAMASSSTTFLGKITDDRLARLYKNAKGVIFASEEDFGIVCVEAQAAGTGVIAYGKGGAVEIIQNHTTGVFFEEQTVESLTSSILSYEQIEIKQNKCIENAYRFNKSKFQAEFKTFVEETWEKHLKINQ